MAQRKKDGTWELDSTDFMARGIQDARKGRTATPPAGGTTAQNQAYTEAYTWGQWFRLQLDRSVI